MSSVAGTMCVLLWELPDRASDVHAYEDTVLALLADHGATLVSRVWRRDDGSDPLEVQLIRIPSDEALAAYLADPRRVALAAQRDACVARTDTFWVDERVGAGP